MPKPASSTAVLVAAVVLAGTLAACSRGPAPASAPPPVVAPPPPPPPAPPPPPPPPPPPAPISPLRGKLLAATDLATFRALAADSLVLTVFEGKRPAKPVTLAPAKLDERRFKKQIAPLLPREPDPAEGEGEDFACNDASGSCVFRDSAGTAITYTFTAGPEPRLREIRKEPPPAASTTAP